MKKRLFLFSSFDKDERISDPLLYYLKNLAKFGDIIFVADNRVNDDDLKKIAPYVIHSETLGKHGEYDWGSYKRAYIYAQKQNILKNYDWIYCVNDSMFLITPIGKTPEHQLDAVFDKIERGDVGSVYYMKSKINNRFIGKIILRKLLWNSVMQSWFIGIQKKFTDTPWFQNFISGVQPIETKREFISKYEIGFSHRARKNNLRVSSFLSGFKNWPFRKPMWMFSHGAPFVKKNSLGFQHSKVNIHEFKSLKINESQMILNEMRFQMGDAEFEKLSRRSHPYTYKRFAFLSVRRHYNSQECYVSDYFIFKWRVFSKTQCN